MKKEKKDLEFDDMGIGDMGYAMDRENEELYMVEI